MKVNVPGTFKRHTIDQRSIRLVLTTDDVAILLGITPDVVRKRIERGHLTFTGNRITDFKMLVAHMK